jgi:hypothetical protein
VRILEVAGLTGRKSSAEFRMRIVRTVVLRNQIEDELVGDCAHVLSPHFCNPPRIFVIILAKLGHKSAQIYVLKCPPAPFLIIRLGGSLRRRDHRRASAEPEPIS